MPEFHRLLENEIPRLRRYARALTRDRPRADDLVQDTLVRGIAKAHLWQEGTDLRAWLFTIMHNQYVNSVRRAQREQATVDVDQLAATLVATTDPTASRQLSELDHALGHLSKGQREVVLLVGLEGMSYDEAAKILRVPIGTIRSRLARARGAALADGHRRRDRRPRQGSAASSSSWHCRLADSRDADRGCGRHGFPICRQI
jgi:RNA polymerase sigma-70 factor (ECF subfamily)